MVLSDILNHYPHETIDDKKNGLQEAVQEIALLGLSRTDFFSKAAFCGGTCLRLFYNLPRFSEDLDFALIFPDSSFNLTSYFNELQRTFLSYGFKVEIGPKEIMEAGNIRSAFIKGGTLSHLLRVFANDSEVKKIVFNQICEVKFEVDINPAQGAFYEERLSLFPSAHYVKTFNGPSLFAGKTHAILCRNWKNRCKGRDLFDYLFYIKNNIPLNLNYLKCKLIQSGKITANDRFEEDEAILLLRKRFLEIEYKDAAKDVFHYIQNSDKDEIAIWSPKMFADSLSLIKFE
jgi:hypothetical protein